MKIKINPERLKIPIKEFYLERLEDESGVSGVGVVARGVILPSGKAVLEWETEMTSIAIYNNIDELIEIHGHHGKTLIQFVKPRRQRRHTEKNLKGGGTR
jgi:hypothetical protein